MRVPKLLRMHQALSKKYSLIWLPSCNLLPTEVFIQELGFPVNTSGITV
jgi:hypothetical protein